MAYELFVCSFISTYIMKTLIMEPKMTCNKLSFDKYHWTGITTFLPNLNHDNNRKASKR